MKTIIKLFVILIALVGATIINKAQATAQQNYVNYQVFYDHLSPYGQWVNYRNYGYVWMPDVGSGFVPYSSNGYWINTDYGMTWVSYYNWGWAPFHYGRWDYDNFYGWFWIPDNEWGPAWVTWRSANGYYGWAPMRQGISITISFGSHYDSNYDYWIFVRDRDIDRHDIHRYCINRNEHHRIIRNSTVIHNTYIDNSRNATYVSGPRRDEIQRNIGRNIRTASVHENNSPGQNLRNDQLFVYRPGINKDNNVRSAPSRITDLNEIKQRRDNQNLNHSHNNRINQENLTKSNEIKHRLKESTSKNYDQITKQQNTDLYDKMKTREQVNTNQSNNEVRKAINTLSSDEIKRNQSVNSNQSDMNKRYQTNNLNQHNNQTRNVSRNENQQDKVRSSTNTRSDNQSRSTTVKSNGRNK